MQALVLVAALLALAAAPLAGAALVCRTRLEAAELVRLAGSEHAVVRALYALSAAGDAADADDLAYERDGVAAELERLNMLVSVHDAALRPNLVAPLLWPSVYVVPDASTGRALAAPPPHAGTLYYDSDGLDPGHAGAWAAGAAPCAALLAPEAARARSEALLPTLDELVAERGFFDTIPTCADVNERLLRDPVTGQLRCDCPVDKVCGSAGWMHSTLFAIAIGLFSALLVIAIVAMLYTAATQLEQRHLAAEGKRNM